MSTKTVDDTLAMWLDLEPEDELSADDRATLDGRLAADPELRAQHQRSQRLHGLLTESRITVREGFHGDVMAALPQAAWQSESGAWRLPLAMMLGFALAAALVLGSVGGDHPVIGTGLALLDFAQSTVLAGSGIVVAAWRGAGMGLEEMITTSSLNMAAFAVFVVCLNLLFLSLLRRRRRAPQAVTESSDS